MKNLIKISCFALVAAALVAATPSSQATCGLTTSRDLMTIQGTCGGGFCYINTDASGGNNAVQANFWRLGSGNPAIGAGDDNGVYLTDGTGGTGPWLFDLSGTGTYILVANTDNGNTDGCIDADINAATPDTAVLAVCDPAGKLVVIAATQNGDTIFDFDLLGVHYTTAGTPSPHITGTTKLSSTQTQINFTTPSLSELMGLYFDNGTGTPASSIFSGVRLYQKIVPRNGSPGDRRVPDPSWTLVGSFGLNASGNVTVNCASNSDTFLGIEPVFDGANPFSAGCVTALPKTVQCGPTVADPSQRLIKKPKVVREAE